MGLGAYRLRAWLRSEWRAAIVLSLLVAIVGGGTLFLADGAQRTLTAPARYAASRGFDFDISFQQRDGRPANAELESLSSVARAESATFVFGGFGRVSTERSDALIFSGSVSAVNLAVVEGRPPAADRPGEFAGSRSFLDATGAKLGDQFTLLTVTQEAAAKYGFDVPEPDGPTVTATLVGVLDGAGALESGFAVAVFSPSLLARFDEIAVAASVGVIALAPGATFDDFSRELGSRPDAQNFTFEPLNLVSGDVRAAVTARGRGIAILAAVAAIAALIVLGQVLSRQARIEAGEIGALRAIGVTRARAAIDPAVRVVVPAVVGIAAAAIVASSLSGRFPLGYLTPLEPHPGARWNWTVCGLGAVALSVCLLVWTYLALRLANRVSPSVAARPSLSERLASRLPSARVATAIRFAFSNRDGRVGSTGSSLAGLAATTTLLFGALAFGTSLTAFVDTPDAWGVNFDYAIGSGGDTVPDGILEQLETDSRVAALTLFGTTGVTAGGTTMIAIGADLRRGDLRPEIVAGRMPETTDEIAVGRLTARDIDAPIGDVLHLEGVDDAIDFRVVGVAVLPNIGESPGPGLGFLVTRAALERLDHGATMSMAGFDIAPSAPDGAAQELARDIGISIGHIDPPSSVVNLDRVRAIPYLVAAVVGALATLALAHATIMAVRRRRRDFAILRSVGAGRRWVSAVVQWQATLTCAVVLVVAVPLGLAAGGSVFRAFVDRLGGRVAVAVPVATILGVAAALVVLANLAAAVPASRVRRIRPAPLLAGA